MDKYDIQKLREIPIEDVAEGLGLRVTRHKCLCPFHDDHHASLSFCVRRNTYRCFVCGAHGNPIDLAMQLLPGLSRDSAFREACRWLADTHNIYIPDSRYPASGSPASGSPASGSPASGSAASRYPASGSAASGSADSRYPASGSPASGSPASGSPASGSAASGSSVRSSPPNGGDAQNGQKGSVGPVFSLCPPGSLSPSAQHFLYAERQLDPRVVRWCRLSSWRDRRGVEWLQIPYFDLDGQLTGIQNRNLTPGAEPRFRFPAGSRCSIYNLPVLRMLRPGESLFITEGASDCWAMLSAGHKAIAIPSATLLGPADKDLLHRLCADPLSILSPTPNFPTSPAGSAARSSPPNGGDVPTGQRGSSISFHMYPDRDVPGERLFLQLKEVLPNLIHHQLPPSCKDFSDYYLLAKGKKQT